MGCGVSSRVQPSTVSGKDYFPGHGTDYTDHAFLRKRIETEYRDGKITTEQYNILNNELLSLQNRPSEDDTAVYVNKEYLQWCKKLKRESKKKVVPDDSEKIQLDVSGLVVATAGKGGK